LQMPGTALPTRSGPRPPHNRERGRGIPRACISGGNPGIIVRLLLLAVCCLCLVEGQWLSSWIEVEPTQPSASLRRGNMSLCDGENATLYVSVRGGAGPWRVEVRRDGKMFTLLTLEARPMQLFPAIFAKQDSDASASQMISTALPGSYTLSRVCDCHYCNGSVSNATFNVSFNTPPLARIVPVHTELCMDGASPRPPAGIAYPRVHLSGVPPFHVTFSLVGHVTTVGMRYNQPGVHDLPAFPSRGLWAVTNVSDSRGCPPDYLSLPIGATVSVSQSPEASLLLRSGEVCGDQRPDIEVRLLRGSAPWSFTLQTPSGKESIDNVTRSSYLYRAEKPGEYRLESIRDASCTGKASAGASSVAVELKHLPTVSAVMHERSERTCQGSFRNISGFVQGTPPWSLEVWKDDTFYRRVLHEQAGGNFSFAVDAPGTYRVRAVTDGRYCSADGTGAVTVEQLPLPELAPISQTACEGDTVELAVKGTPPLKVHVTASNSAKDLIFTADSCVPAAGHGKGWCSIKLFSKGEAAAGLYTVTGVEDSTCFSRTQRSLQVLAKPAITMRSVIGDVCGGSMARLEVEIAGGTLPWHAQVRYPDGEVRKIESDKAASAWDVSSPGEYKLVGGEAGKCGAHIGGMDGAAEQVVHVRHFPAPSANISGGVMSCVGQSAEVQVQVEGGQWPYSVVLLHNGLHARKEPLLVTRSDGLLAVPVSEPGEYTLASVKDARRCGGLVSGRATVKHHPRSKAGFTKVAHTMCAGSTLQVEVRVAGEGAPPPWQVTVLRDEQFFTASAVHNTTEGGGGFTFDTHLAGTYKLSQDGFVDARGCTGTVLKPLRVSVAQLPTVTVSSGSVCEGGSSKAVLRFTGEPPWAFTIKRGGSNETAMVDDIWKREYPLDLPSGEYVITSVADRVGTGSCNNSQISVPIIVRPRPSVTIESTSCRHLCRDEVGGLIVNLTEGTPPFTIQVQDQYGAVLEQSFAASAGELRLEKGKIVSLLGIADPSVWGAHNWTVKSVVDANQCTTSFAVPITSATVETVLGSNKPVHGVDGASEELVIKSNVEGKQHQTKRQQQAKQLPTQQQQQQQQQPQGKPPPAEKASGSSPKPDSEARSQKL